VDLDALRDWLRRDVGGAWIRRRLIAAGLAIGALAEVRVASRIRPVLAMSGQ